MNSLRKINVIKLTKKEYAILNYCYPKHNNLISFIISKFRSLRKNKEIKHVFNYHDNIQFRKVNFLWNKSSNTSNTSNYSYTIEFRNKKPTKDYKNIENDVLELSKSFKKEVKQKRLKRKQKRKKDKEQANEYKVFNKEYKKQVKQNNTKSQKELKQQYIKENGKLPDYIQNDNEILFVEHNGKIYISHQFGNKQKLIINKRTGKCKSNLYNNLSKEYNATIENYVSLKEKEKNTLDFYSGDGFIEFNGWKREGIQYFLKKGDTINVIVEKIEKFTEYEKTLNGMAVPLEHDMVFYRGQQNLHHDLNKGNVVAWDSFTSTSMGLGPGFGYGNGNYLYEIHVNKGQKAIPLLQQGNNSKEIEMLLPSEQQFIVEGTKEINGMQVIQVTLV